MKKIHKVITYCGLAFAAFLIVSILTGISFGFNILSDIFNNDKINLSDDLKAIELANTQVKNLEIKLDATKLAFKIGDELKIETNNKKIMVEEKNYELRLKENNNWFSKKSNSQLVITIPSSYLFDLVTIKAGVGRISIEELNAKKIDFNLGAGKVKLSNLNVSDTAKIKGGAGSVTISSGIINNLNLNIGVGTFTLNSRLIGNNSIDAGIGTLKINLYDSINSYRIKMSKGIGTIKLNSEDIINNKTYGNGSNYITIDGGIGSINVNTEAIY